MAAVGVMERFADPPRQMDIGRPYHDRAVPFFDVHRVLGLLLLLLVAGEMQEFVLVADREFAADRQFARRIRQSRRGSGASQMFCCAPLM